MAKYEGMDSIGLLNVSFTKDDEKENHVVEADVASGVRNFIVFKSSVESFMSINSIKAPTLLADDDGVRVKKVPEDTALYIEIPVTETVFCMTSFDMWTVRMPEDMSIVVLKICGVEESATNTLHIKLAPSAIAPIALPLTSLVNPDVIRI